MIIRLGFTMNDRDKDFFIGSVIGVCSRKTAASERRQGSFKPPTVIDAGEIIE